MVGMIYVDAFSCLGTSDLARHLQDTGKSVSWLHCAVPLDSKETAT